MSCAATGRPGPGSAAYGVLFPARQQPRAQLTSRVCGLCCLLAADLFPDMPEDKRVAFYMEKEQRFRDMAGAVS